MPTYLYVDEDTIRRAIREHYPDLAAAVISATDERNRP
jgi:hypothetical protein